MWSVLLRATIVTLDVSECVRSGYVVLDNGVQVLIGHKHETSLNGLRNVVLLGTKEHSTTLNTEDSSGILEMHSMIWKTKNHENPLNDFYSFYKNSGIKILFTNYCYIISLTPILMTLTIERYNEKIFII